MKSLLFFMSLVATTCALSFGASDVSTSGTVRDNEKELTNFYRNLLLKIRTIYEAVQDARKRLDAGEDVDVSTLRKQLIPFFFGPDDIRPFLEEYILALPIWQGLNHAQAADGIDGEKQRLAFAGIGEGLWHVLKSDRAAPIMRALANLVEEGNLYLLPLEAEKIGFDGRFALLFD